VVKNEHLRQNITNPFISGSNHTGILQQCSINTYNE